jgi:hypothetical protein
MNTVTVTLSSRYSNKTTTVRAKTRPTLSGEWVMAEISRDQLNRAAKRCCYAGNDWPRVVGSPEGFSLDAWEPTGKGGLSAIRRVAP